MTTGSQAKPRPALVILDTGDSDVLLARVTTHLYDTSYDVPLADWKAAGLLAPSVVRLHKLATLHKSLIGDRLRSFSKPHLAYGRRVGAGSLGHRIKATVTSLLQPASR